MILSKFMREAKIGPAVPIFGYWYPNDPRDPVRVARARELGKNIPNELELAKQAVPLFEKHPVYGSHKPARVYCLGDKSQNVWVDTDDVAMQLQLNLLEDSGIDGLIWSTYVGTSSGETFYEMCRPFETFLRQKNSTLKYANMFCLKKSRIFLPISDKGDEPDECRRIDINENTAEAMIDYVAKYWSDSNYIRFGARPYLGLCKFGVSEEQLPILRNFIQHLRDYSLRKYDTFPHIVGIIKDIHTARIWHNAGADSMSSYAFLLDWHDNQSRPVQIYTEQIEKRKQDWLTLSAIGKYAPSVVTGFDSTARGGPINFKYAIGKYPHTPICIGSAPDIFEDWLRSAVYFAEAHLPKQERYVAVVLNEYGEGACIYPVVTDSCVDSSYLNSIAKVKM